MSGEKAPCGFWSMGSGTRHSAWHQGRSVNDCHNERGGGRLALSLRAALSIRHTQHGGGLGPRPTSVSGAEQGHFLSGCPWGSLGN